MTIRDQIALSLCSFRRRRSSRVVAGLLQELGRNDPEPADCLETLVEWVENAPSSVAGRVARLRQMADELIQRAQTTELEPVVWCDPRYPGRLRETADPPLVVWVKGDPGSLTAPAVAVVGSRAASAYGLSMARQLGRDLGAAGVTVVSGLARGCDGAAHRGALEAGARTVAVVGCGADIVYPSEHRDLYNDITRNGAVISELPPGAPPLPGHFPRRNRIISGLSLAVVVVEASSRSGSLITVECALEQGREVLAVPGNVLSERHRGCNDLLRDGARLVQTAQDVLEELGWNRDLAHPPDSTGPASTPDAVLTALAPGEDCDVDTIAVRTGLAPSAIMSHLTRLELAGTIQRAAGGRFVRGNR